MRQKVEVFQKLLLENSIPIPVFDDGGAQIEEISDPIEEDAKVEEIENQ